METFTIEKINGDDYITSNSYGLTLKVIPPDKQNDDVPYPAYMAVAAVFEDNRPDLIRESFESDEAFQDAVFDRVNGYGDGERYDFLSEDIAFKDEDTGSKSNKQIWFDAINYYCQVVLDKPVVDLVAHNYNYDAEY